jgi:hypothetical protein
MDSSVVCSNLQRRDPAQPCSGGVLCLSDERRLVFALSIGIIGLTGAIALFLLRRLAVVLFSLALALNLLLTAFQTMRTNWTEALGGSGLFGVLLGWGILVVVILYTRGLAKKGVLL